MKKLAVSLAAAAVLFGLVGVVGAPDSAVQVANPCCKTVE